MRSPVTSRTDARAEGGRLRFLRGLFRHVDLVRRGYHPAYLDYPSDPTPRYGWGKPPHRELEKLLESGRARYVGTLAAVAGVTAGLRSIGHAPAADGRAPHWQNGYVSGLDAATLYAFPKLFGTARYVEIGSGHSTKFVARSVADHSLDLRLVSIDPSPRADVDALCDTIVREPLERAPLDVFDDLEANDVVALDGSHRCLQNSDVTAFFLDVLPRLAAGVLVYIDDVYLPLDYPPEWRDRHYSEQYLLAVLLLADRQERYETVLPCHFSFVDPELRAASDRVWEGLGLQDVGAIPPNGFWMRVRKP